MHFFVWLTDEFYEKVLGDPVMLGDVANHLDDQGVLRTKQSGSYRETQRGGANIEKESTVLVKSLTKCP